MQRAGAVNEIDDADGIPHRAPAAPRTAPDTEATRLGSTGGTRDYRRGCSGRRARSP